METKQLPFEDGDRIALVEDEIEMSVNIGDERVRFSEGTAPAGVSLLSDDLKPKSEQRSYPLEKLEELKQSGWETTE